MGVIVGLLNLGSGMGPFATFLGLVASIIYIVVAQKRAGQLTLKRLNGDHAYVAGACREFLNSLE